MALTAMERVRAAEDAVEQLRTELGRAGVVLPSLRIDPLTCGGHVLFPLVDLGRCNMDMALRLVAVLAGTYSAEGAPPIGDTPSPSPAEPPAEPPAAEPS
ncbi:hypothetical protein ACWGLE_30310 [Streptomyces sp. NPDC055897]